MKNFWLDKKEKNKKEFEKKINYINKLLNEFDYRDYIFLAKKSKGKKSA